MGNGKSIRFWEDCWCGETNLATQYWGLYSIVVDQHATIDEVWDGGNLKINFRRCFSSSMMIDWNNLFEEIKTLV